MRKIIYSKFDKKAISLLPPVSFSGRIITILSEGEAEKAVDYLLSSKILGVDTETRPAFHKGESHKVSLLQVANHDTCFLFRLNRIGMCPPIIRLLEDTTVPKIGLSWHDDLLSLHRRTAFVPGFFIDLQDIVGLLGIKDMSLQKLYANIFHEKISKRQRLTNWDADVLNEKQQVYAAIDAWACVNLYEEISRLMKTKDYDLIANEEEKQDTDNNKIALSSNS
ncbi:3'-5' exonuclease [Prevotella sp. DNF00663]|uniref:3'-5' exonuclease n=1 Tax=unclassified Prevotella TaxID=2638335 RepID=UPI000513F458|nr:MULTISPECIES: 3'-5' exonuclease [unclassified Prevotella]KGI59557.1 3'-5' exonuclease [Prevotella sp. S7 MS 2]KXB83439.1 3'-5' exonuclease [Prevotella sp. DNF00663]